MADVELEEHVAFECTFNEEVEKFQDVREKNVDCWGLGQNV